VNVGIQYEIEEPKILEEEQKKILDGDIIKKYECEHCDISFTSKFNLKRHIEGIHNNMSKTYTKHIKKGGKY
jgi:hypothetical protein